MSGRVNRAAWTPVRRMPDMESPFAFRWAGIANGRESSAQLITELVRDAYRSLAGHFAAMGFDPTLLFAAELDDLRAHGT
ncbi:hypothetical protein ACFVGY_18965 [Streptomyces sp. NPDC127106]|uniref:hypothetical protein n=1 Tax=Streptomyces sp. NPDC127106 TaxID=3345360 RepID=UPI0036453A53